MTGATAVVLTIQRQLQSLWCWTACSSSTSEFYDATSTWTQCRLANEELEQTTCCADGSSRACNQAWYVDRALTRTGNLALRRVGQATAAEISSEIDAGRPVCARIGWQGGGGHFVLIIGYTDGPSGLVLAVEDPWTGSASVEFDAFANRYQTNGSWTHTYWTRG